MLGTLVPSWAAAVGSLPSWNVLSAKSISALAKLYHDVGNLTAATGLSSCMTLSRPLLYTLKRHG